MEFSIAYVQPLIEWLRHHPEWAAAMVFLISFMESLAIVGSIVPGSVMMTMVGILAGTGVIGLKSCLTTAILGAIAGDGGSYFLGYYFSERLALLWPFSRYPNWLSYGKTYFERHGGKSVFIGRFVGPLRSIIPVIAGMMKMKHLHFFIANVCSAIGWSLIYLGPGILVGAASSSLSTQTATKLFLVIIALLLILWLMGIGIQKLWSRLYNLLHPFLHKKWSQMQHLRVLKSVVETLTPKGETQHAKTFSGVLLCLFFTGLSILLTQDILHQAICNRFDLPIYFFLQSIRTHAFDVFFTTMLLLIHPIPLFALAFTQIVYGLWTKHLRLTVYWISLCLLTILLCFGFDNELFYHAQGLLSMHNKRFCLPVHCLALATGIFGFFSLTVLSSNQLHVIFSKTMKWLVSSFIFFTSIALIYLGETWFSSIITAFSIGCALSLWHWLFYRRNPVPISFKFCFGALGTYVLIASFVLAFNFHHTLKAHQPHPTQYMLTHEAWWSQEKPLLPIYSNNRLGQPAGLFNLQYSGPIDAFEHALMMTGWEKKSTSFIQNLIARASEHPGKFSLIGQFYLNQKPDLVMSYGRKGAKPILLLSLWRSNFHLLYTYHPLWIGTIQLYKAPKRATHTKALMATPFYPLLHALRDYKIRTIDVTNVQLPAYGPSVKLLLIQK